MQGGGAVDQNAEERKGEVNIEPGICNGYFPYPVGGRWVEKNA